MRKYVKNSRSTDGKVHSYSFDYLITTDIDVDEAEQIILQQLDSIREIEIVGNPSINNESWTEDEYGITSGCHGKSKKQKKQVESSRMIKSSHTWDDFDKFENLDKYLPPMGDGDNKGTQAATAVSKLVYRWFNDGDVFDNNYGLTGWANDISGCANWLEKYVRAASPILATIEDIGDDEDEYTDLLYDLCEAVDPLIPELAEEPKEGNAYDEDGPYSFSEKYEDEDEDW